MPFAEPPAVVKTPSQHADKIGFTPWAKDHLIGLTNDGEDGFATDFKVRLYIMGGTVDGKRMRREVRGTVTTVFADYTGRWGFNRLWVQWKDGRRHLVHRKS